MNYKPFYWVGLICSLHLASCGSESKEAGSALPNVTVVEVMKMDIPVNQEFVGEVSGLYDIPIRARVDGYLEGRFFNEGARVKKDQLLYLIDAQPYQAEVASKQSAVAEAKTLLVNAENELNRVQPLAEINAVSKSDLDAAIAEKGAAEASLEAAEANLELSRIQLGYTQIKSPIDGVIGKTKAKRGEYVGREPNPVILNTVSRIDTILVQFFITESDYLRIAREYLIDHDSIPNDGRNRDDRDANLKLVLSDGSIHDYMGIVDFIDREVDPTTGSMLVQASFPNPKRLVRPGQFARVIIEMRTEQDAMVIPLRSVMMIQGESNVFVCDENNVIQKRKIQPLTTKGDLVVVKEGINHGDRIVLDGLQLVRSGVTVNAKDTTFKSQSKLPF